MNNIVVWDREKLNSFLNEEWGQEDAPAIMQQIQNWVDRGDGAAIYRNHDLGSLAVGEPRIVSYGSPAAQLEVTEPPEQLPDIGGAINWRFRLEAVYGGPCSE